MLENTKTNYFFINMNSLGVKLLFYPIYVLFLYLNSFLTPSLVLLPLLFLIVPLNNQLKQWLIIISFALDTQLSSKIITPFSTQDLFTQLNIDNQKISSHLIMIVLNVLSLVILYQFSWVLAYLRKIKTYITLLFYLTIFIIFYTFLIHLDFTTMGTGQKYFLYLLAQVSKKIWIIYLLATSVNLIRSKSYLEIASGFSMFSANFRETFSIDQYKDDNHSSYWNAIKISALFCALIYFFSITTYTYMNFPLTETFRLTWTCKPPTLSINPSHLIHFSRLQIAWCFFQNEIIYGIVRHLLIDSIILFLVPNILGYRFTFPFGNFLKAQTWNSFMSKLFYFYSMIIYRIFILEIYAFIKDLSKKNSKSFFKFAIALGVFIGAFFYHFFKDYNYFLPKQLTLIANYPFSPLILLYFLTLSLSSLIGMTFEKYTKFRLNEIIILFLFLILLLGRSFYDSYRFSIDPIWKFKNIDFLLQIFN